MGGKHGKASARGVGTYEVVEREEPLLNDSEPPVKLANERCELINEDGLATALALDSFRREKGRLGPRRSGCHRCAGERRCRCSGCTAFVIAHDVFVCTLARFSSQGNELDEAEKQFNCASARLLKSVGDFVLLRLIMMLTMIESASTPTGLTPTTRNVFSAPQTPRLST